MVIAIKRNYRTNDMLKEIFQGEHYARMKADNEQRQKWREYVSSSCIDNLVVKAGELFELVESELNGIITFVPGMRMYQEGIFTCINDGKKNKKGTPICWHVQGSEELSKRLYLSSDVEIEIWRRLLKEKPTKDVKVFKKILTPATIEKYLGRYCRNFNSTYNSMPQTVESAFNHIPQLNCPLKVKGFSYPHKKDKTLYG